MGIREIVIQGEDLKFSCAHFVAFRGFRERLHGHNYTVKLKMAGSLGEDGYVLDFGIAKKSLRACCKRIHEFLIVPTRSDVLDIQVKGQQLEIVVIESGSFFSLPLQDCVLLPIVHSTAEEIAEYLWYEVGKDITHDLLKARGIQWMEIHVYERPSQGAIFRKNL